MNQVGLRELNQNTSQVIERVKRGETLEITERGRAVAHLTPVHPDTSVLARLVAEGRAVPPTSTAYGPLLLPPTLGDPKVAVSDELAAARDDEN